MAERRLGQALAATSISPVVGTKIGYSFRDAPKPDEFFVGAPQLEAYVDWSEAGVERSFELSLERLGVDRVDILYLHDTLNGDFGEMVRVGAAAARRWQEEGLVGAVGAGMNYTEDCLALLEQVELDCLLIAGRITLLDQSAAESLLPLCAARGVAVIVGGVDNSGILARPDASARFDYAPAAAELVERARKIGAVCEKHGIPLSAAALQYPFHYPAVASVIPGMRLVKEVNENLHGFKVEIPPELWSDLEKTGLILSLPG